MPTIYPSAQGELILSKATIIVESTTGDSIIIALLVLSWFILAITYNISPVFRRSFMRYFNGHQFYVKDVLNRHVRTILPGASILIQHIFITGIAFYCIGNNLFSVAGRQFLFSKYPVIAILGEGSFVFLWWGVLIAFLFEVICLLWLRLVNPRLTHFAQIINLYPWLLQLNLIVVTVVATVFISDNNPLILYVLGVLFLLLFISPFIIASIDAADFSQQKQRIWVVSSTTVLYILLLTGLAAWIFLSPNLLNIVERAATL